MPVPRVIGFVLLVVGVLLLIFGYNATESVTESVTETVTGRYSDTTMAYLIGGAAATAAGIGTLLWGWRR